MSGKIAKVIAAALVLALIFLAFRFTVLLGAKDPNTTTNQTVEISAGSTHAQIAKQLSDAGLVKSPVAFLAYLRLTRATIQPGPYQLSANESASEIAGRLTKGDYQTIKITLLEGWRATDMEKYLVADKGLKQLVGFGAAAQADEGYLFPDTYEVRVDITTPDLIKLLRDNFQKRTADLKNITPDVIILASIIEREAGSDADRPIIASVYENRLKQGMKLQADPTVQYALGSWAVITAADLANTTSPYNTYLNAGLPPGPICNPGLASIKAAITPASTNYLFFFTAHSQTYYSTTLAEQQAKIKLYFN